MIKLSTKYEEDVDTGCWIWTGQKDSHGYGVIELPGYRMQGLRRVIGAHRVMWEMVHGLTDAEHVHHQCENPPCVNPMHLKPMTQQENNRLAYPTYQDGTCKRGHSDIRLNRQGRHYCRTCNTQRMARVRLREKVI